METKKLLAATIRVHFQQSVGKGYQYSKDGVLYYINQETFNECLSGTYNSMTFQLNESSSPLSSRKIIVAECIEIELSEYGKAMQAMKLETERLIKVSRHTRELLGEAYEAGRLSETARVHNELCESSGEEGHKRAVISFDDWYIMRVVDSTGKEDILIR